MPPRRTLTFAPARPQAFNDSYLLAGTEDPGPTLGELLSEQPALCFEPLTEAFLRLRVASLIIRTKDPAADTPLYLPPGLSYQKFLAALGDGDPPEVEPQPPVSETEEEETGDETPPQPDPVAYPSRISDREAVLIAHADVIDKAASYLSGGLSVLIACEKLLVEHLAGEIAARSGRATKLVQASAPGGPGTSGQDPTGYGGGRRADLMTALQKTIAEATSEDVIVVPHLDLLAGGSDASLSGEARELTDLLYERSERIILAFTDPTLVIPEVLANRFAIRLSSSVLPRMARARDGDPVPIGQALVTEAEAKRFDGFDPIALYKHIAGMNAVRLRHGLRYAYHQFTDASDDKRPEFRDLLQELRIFKARANSAFEVPNVSLDSIGGYDDVKAELDRALRIISGAASDHQRLSEELRLDLIPRGFIFHGPPGTGKTLFAKAIASKLDATIMVVSGPEITDMYVGESERKLRELFAEARRSAPAVLVFDEFDSIAGKRSGRDDGGSRAGNAIVAQLLTELDGFRPEVQVLVIGTTNRIDIIDDALLRPSRFRPIKIDLPDLQARRAIAAVHAEHFGIEHSDELLDAIAAATEGMNGDEIRSIFRDARADELVGGHRRPDARRLGELTGALLMAKQQREIEKTQSLGRSAPQQARSHFIPLPRRRIETTASAQDTSDGGEPDS